MKIDMNVIGAFLILAFFALIAVIIFYIPEIGRSKKCEVGDSSTCRNAAELSADIKDNCGSTTPADNENCIQACKDLHRIDKYPYSQLCANHYGASNLNYCYDDTKFDNDVYQEICLGCKPGSLQYCEEPGDTVAVIDDFCPRNTHADCNVETCMEMLSIEGEIYDQLACTSTYCKTFTDFITECEVCTTAAPNQCSVEALIDAIDDPDKGDCPNLDPVDDKYEYGKCVSSCDFLSTHPQRSNDEVVCNSNFCKGEDYSDSNVLKEYWDICFPCKNENHSLINSNYCDPYDLLDILNDSEYDCVYSDTE